MGIAEEGIDPEGIAQRVMVGKFGAVVLGQGAAQLGWQRHQPVIQLGGGWCGLTAGGLGQQDKSRGTFLGDQHGLAISAEQHIVGFPVSWLTACIDIEWTFADGNTVFDVLNRAASLAATITTLELGTWQIEPPGKVLGAADLGVDEAVDALVTDGCCRLLLPQAPSDLLRGPTVLQAAEDQFSEFVVALEFGPGPPAGSGLLLSIDRFVSDFGAAIALQFARDCRWRAIQSCRDLWSDCRSS